MRVDGLEDHQATLDKSMKQFVAFLSQFASISCCTIFGGNALMLLMDATSDDNGGFLRVANIEELGNTEQRES
jgi:hypothetical protein